MDYLPHKSQDSKLMKELDCLLQSIYDLNDYDPVPSVVVRTIQNIYTQINNTPALTRMTNKLGVSLLKAACEKFECMDNSNCFDVVKYVIQSNPSALRQDFHQPGVAPIYHIASSKYLCAMMPWIAKKFPWILNSKHCLKNPPLFKMISCGLVNEMSYNVTTLRQFLETYPHGLTQECDDGNILHMIISHHTECNPALFKWLAKQHPSSMASRNLYGLTPLFFVCLLLVKSSGLRKSKAKEICLFLISSCPESIRMSSNTGTLPIHILLDHCQNIHVREIAVHLLREYPESYWMSFSSSRQRTTKRGSICISYNSPSPPCSVYFLWLIWPYLTEEKELKDNIHSLEQLIKITNNEEPICKAGKVFNSWSISKVNDLQNRLELTTETISEICRS